MTAPILKSLPNYKKFFIDLNNNLFGFIGNNLEAITVQDINSNKKKILSFFVIDQVIYLTIESDGENFHYRQKNGIIENVTSIPKKPIQNHEILESKNFKISTYTYDEKTFSKVSNLFFKGSAVFLKISGSYEAMDGLYFNVLESLLPGKPPSLYFFPINRTSVNMVKEKGEIW